MSAASSVLSVWVTLRDPDQSLECGVPLGLSSRPETLLPKGLAVQSQALESLPPPAGKTLPAAQAAQSPCWAGADAQPRGWMEPPSPFIQMGGLRPKAVSCTDSHSQSGSQTGWLQAGPSAGGLFVRNPPGTHPPNKVFAVSSPHFFLGAQREDRVTQSTLPRLPGPTDLGPGWVPPSPPLPAPR